MARLYYRHEPAEEIPGICGISGDHWYFSIPRRYFVDDWMYLCVVHEGRVYAGRRITTPTLGEMNSMKCVDFNDNETGRQILLKHFLLGE